MQAKRGFTLVEILIVVVILGILAAIVIPQFTQASTEAKTNSLCSDLQTLRSQIELFKVQHNDMPPGNTIDGTTGVLAADVTAFENQMLYVTNISGTPKTPLTKVRETGVDAEYIYGPYLERIPPNPFNDQNGLQEVADQTAAKQVVTPDEGCGWGYVPGTGEIYAVDGGTTSNGVHHADL